MGRGVMDNRHLCSTMHKSMDSTLTATVLNGKPANILSTDLRTAMLTAARGEHRRLSTAPTATAAYSFPSVSVYGANCFSDNVS